MECAGCRCHGTVNAVATSLCMVAPASRRVCSEWHMDYEQHLVQYFSRLVHQEHFLKYAGPSGYRNTRWLFMGLILGQFVVGGLWLIIDGFTGMTGNRIRMY